ncbi:hypothetical protein [Prevotella histicola]|uniref:hypothetical protein n=1 Tax=Prevotella histicola TaxID=470565 RepID=UPI0028E1B8B4|nr:hypothetical protein [Prevotella histicola]
MNSKKKLSSSGVNQSQSGKFYYVATALLLLLVLDKPYNPPAKGFRLYLRQCRRVSKLLLAKILCGIFKFIDKYIKSRDNKQLGIKILQNEIYYISLQAYSCIYGYTYISQ